MAGKAVPVPQRTQQGLVIDIDAAHLAQQQREQHLVAGTVHHAAAGLVGGIDAVPPMPPADAVLLPVPGIVTVVLQDRQNGLVTGAQVVLGARDAIVTIVPGVIADAP